MTGVARQVYDQLASRLVFEVRVLQAKSSPYQHRLPASAAVGECEEPYSIPGGELGHECLWNRRVFGFAPRIKDAPEPEYL